MKKLTKKQEEEFKIKMLKQEIESEKVGLDRYVKTIVRYSFVEICTSGAYFNELFNKLILNGEDHIRDSKKSEKQKDELRKILFPMFFEGNTKLELLEANLKYYNNLTSWAKFHMDRLNDKQKEKIVRDCLAQEEMWSRQFNKNSRVYDKLKEKKR